jgi:hypothetical protein
MRSAITSVAFASLLLVRRRSLVGQPISDTRCMSFRTEPETDRDAIQERL